MRRLSIALVLMGWLCTGTAFAADIPVTKPEKAGLSGERLQAVDALMERYVEAGWVAGAVTMVARDGKLVYFESRGQRGADDATPLGKDDLFRIYSMTKPITAVALMQLYEQGRFQLTDPVSKYVPELASLTVLKDGERVPVTRQMTMQQLLTHTTGMSYGFDPNDPVDKLYREAGLFESSNLDEFVQRLAALPLKFEPGETWHYSVAVDVTGLVVERLSGKSLDVYLRDHIFAPLGMEDTFFSVPDDKAGRFLPNHRWDAAAGKLVTLPEESFMRFRNTTLFSGGGGLVSTAMDYLRFCEMLRAGGEFNGVRIIGAKTLRYMTRNHLNASVTTGGTGESLGGQARRGFGFGLGFGLVEDAAANGVIGSDGEYFWGGAAGTVFWIDPVEDLIVISMIQLMGSPHPLRADLKSVTYQALLDSRE